MTLTEMETRIEEIEKQLGDKGQHTQMTYTAIETALDDIRTAKQLERDVALILECLESTLDN